MNWYMEYMAPNLFEPNIFQARYKKVKTENGGI